MNKNIIDITKNTLDFIHNLKRKHKTVWGGVMLTIEKDGVINVDINIYDVPRKYREEITQEVERFFEIKFDAKYEDGSSAHLETIITEVGEIEVGIDVFVEKRRRRSPRKNV